MRFRKLSYYHYDADACLLAQKGAHLQALSIACGQDEVCAVRGKDECKLLTQALWQSKANVNSAPQPGHGSGAGCAWEEPIVMSECPSTYMNHVLCCPGSWEFHGNTEQAAPGSRASQTAVKLCIRL